ncbi:DUF637 domain-containing protein [Pseudomonas sp. RC3H12]|nr:DUF637 domain-containing protein [Pseudomonas sp. RC3H12]
MTSYALPHDWGNAVLGLSQVSLTALTGDVINERSVTRLEGRAGGEHVTKDLVDTAARIEAANNLTITAGQDIGIVGGAVQAGGNIDMDAGRDLIIASQEGVDSHEYQRRRVSGHDTSITQYGSEVKAGGNLTATAGQDLSIVASEIEARRDLALQAGRDVTLAAAANEEHSYAKGKKGKTKYERQEDDVEQQSAEVKAGGDLTIDAGRDLRMVASKASAGDEAYLVAGDKLELLAANDSQYSLYDMNKKGGWGSKKTQRDEVTDVKAVGSEITSGGDLTLESGGDQLYQGAKLASGADLTIDSGGSVTFEAVKDMHQESHEKSKGDLAWNSMKGKGSTDETLRQSQLVAQGEVLIKAVDGLKIDIRQIDQKTVSQAIDSMVAADPQLAWLKDAERRGDVDWRQVKELHESFKYSHSGLGQGAMLAIIIIVTVLTAGAASGAIGTAAGATAGSGSAMAAGTAATATTAATSAGWANMALTAVATSAASGATISTINNRGDLGAVFKDVTSSESLKNYVIAGVSAGVGGYVADSSFITQMGTRLAVSSALKTVASGGKFIDNVGEAALGLAADALTGAVYNQVGSSLVGSGLPTRVAVHAIVGGLIGEMAGGDFATSALAAGANKALIQMYGEQIFPGAAHDQLLAMTSQLLGMSVAAVAGGSDKDQQVAGWVAQQATVNNYLKHEEVDKFAQELVGCRGAENPAGCRGGVLDKYEGIRVSKTGAWFEGCKAKGEGDCSNQYTDVKAGSSALDALAELSTLTNDERAMVRIIQDRHYDEERQAQYFWYQTFMAESGAAGIATGLAGRGSKGSGPDRSGSGPSSGVLGLEPKSGSSKANASNTPRFIADSAGNIIDLEFTKGLTKTNVTVAGTRGGVQYPLQGQTPNSYANLGNGHAVVYGPEGRALYDVSSSRIKVVEWNQAPNGSYFPKKGNDTKAFEGNVPQSVLEHLGLN